MSVEAQCPAHEPRSSARESAHLQRNQSRLTPAATKRKMFTGAMRVGNSEDSLPVPLSHRIIGSSDREGQVSARRTSRTTEPATDISLSMNLVAADVSPLIFKEVRADSRLRTENPAASNSDAEPDPNGGVLTKPKNVLGMATKTRKRRSAPRPQPK